MPRYAFLVISLPPEVGIVDERDFEDSCGEDLHAFTHTLLSCVVADGGRTIKIDGGFQSAATTNLTDSDGLYYPPDLSFTLDKF